MWFVNCKQDLARILDALLTRHARHAAALADVAQRHMGRGLGARVWGGCDQSGRPCQAMVGHRSPSFL